MIFPKLKYRTGRLEWNNMTLEDWEELKFLCEIHIKDGKRNRKVPSSR